MIIEITRNNLDILNDSFLFSKKEYFINEIKNNPYAKIVVYKDNDILGYLYYSDIYERCEINQIEVEYSYRKCGIGTFLLRYLTENVKKSITLEVNINNVSAINLYKKFNFKEKAIRKGYYNGIDGILMEREKTI